MAERKLRVFVNGLGVMGRDFIRVIEEYGTKNMEIVGGNDTHPGFTPENLANGLNFDTVYRNFRGFVVGIDKPPISHSDEVLEYKDGSKSIGLIQFKTDGLERVIAIFKETNPERIPYRELEVDIVYDCTGHYLSRTLAQRHIDAGAKLVHLSGPPSDTSIIPIVIAVNDNQVDYDKDKIYSGGSCTTTALATKVKALHGEFGVKRGLMLTHHSYTNDQETQDGWSRFPERSRAAAESYKYSSTGAARMVGIVIPELRGKIDGKAIRATHFAVSALDFIAEYEKQPSIKDVNDFLTMVASGSNGQYREFFRRLGITDQVVTSSDLIGNPLSVLVELRATNFTDEGKMVGTSGHYDNVRMFTMRQKEFMKNHTYPYINSK